jgi:hypothetical protein
MADRNKIEQRGARDNKLKHELVKLSCLNNIKFKNK